MNHSRGALMAPISRKRKEREGFFTHPIKQVQPLPFHPNTTSSFKHKPPEPAPSNRLLAGYMAHEFLTQGTFLGQKFDPARAEAVPPQDLSRFGATAEPDQRRRSHAEVARLMKTDGAHILGIVNPTQLARWIQM